MRRLTSPMALALALATSSLAWGQSQAEPSTPGDSTAASTEAATSESPVELEVESKAGERLLVGDRFEVVVTARYPAGVEVHFPHKPYLGKHLKLVGQRKRTQPAATPGAEISDIHTLEVLSLRTGRQQLVSIEVPFVGPEAAGSTKTESVTLEVHSRLATELDPQLKQAANAVEVTQRNWLLIWSLAGLSLAALAALLTLLAVRMWGHLFVKHPPPPPPRPAHVIAFERLAALSGKGYIEAAEFKLFYLELSEIVREYFGNRYSILALGDTSSELREHLVAIAPVGLNMPELETFLEDSDLVKFAKLTPSPEDAQRSTDTARRLIETTLLEPAPEQALAEERPAIPALQDVTPLSRLHAFSIDLLFFCLVVLLPTITLIRDSSIGWALAALGGWALFMLCRDLLPPGSPGKRLLRLRLLSAAADNRPASWRRVMTRNLVLALPLVGVVAEAVWMRFDGDSRRAGDRLGGTRIVDTRSAPSGVAVALGTALLATTALGVGVWRLLVLSLGQGGMG